MIELDPVAAARFVRAHTVVRSPAALPELRLHIADDSLDVWEATEAEVNRGQLDPPFWAFPWVGGLALARYLLDHPALVAGREVCDVACGCGVVGIAAALAGAAAVRAVDIDPVAVAAARLNAAANRVPIQVHHADAAHLHPAPGTIVTAGDVFYERSMTYTLLRAFDDYLARGARVLVGDPDRQYRPADRLAPLATVEVAVDADLEDAPMKHVVVAELRHPQLV